jgi:hypothetical protein
MTNKYRSYDPVSRGNHSGNRGSMRRFVGSGAALTVMLVAAWRASSEVLERRADLRARGALGPLLAERRVRLLEAALVRAGVRERERVLVTVATHPGAEVDLRSYASVYVGRVGVGVDVDDVGLLEGAMRRAAAERMDVSATGVSRRRGIVRRADRPRAPERAGAALAPTTARPRAAASRPAVPSTNWRRLLGDVDIVHDHTDDAGSGAPIWAVPLGALGTVLTFVPLVRPLGDASLPLAIGGAALVLAGWLGARRS